MKDGRGVHLEEEGADAFDQRASSRRVHAQREFYDAFGVEEVRSGRFLPAEFSRELVARPLTETPTEAEYLEAEESDYRWWWEFLRESPDYPPQAGAEEGSPLADMYRDFGALGSDFRKWWRDRGRYVFSDKNGSAIRVLVDEASEDYALPSRLILQVDLWVPAWALEEEFASIVERFAPPEEDPIDPDQPFDYGSYRQQKRRLLPRSNKGPSPFERLLKVWSSTRSSPTSSPWQIGEALGYSYESQSDTNSAITRLQKRARNLVYHAARGRFPCYDDPASAD